MTWDHSRDQASTHTCWHDIVRRQGTSRCRNALPPRNTGRQRPVGGRWPSRRSTPRGFWDRPSTAVRRRHLGTRNLLRHLRIGGDCFVEALDTYGGQVSRRPADRHATDVPDGTGILADPSRPSGPRRVAIAATDRLCRTVVRRSLPRRPGWQDDVWPSAGNKSYPEIRLAGSGSAPHGAGARRSPNPAIRRYGPPVFRSPLRFASCSRYCRRR